MTQVLRALRFDRMRALRALSRGMGGSQAVPWRVDHGFFLLSLTASHASAQLAG
jgi:hypothetical protein